MVAALLLFLAASTPGSTSDFANRILSGRAPIVVAIYSIGSTSSADDRAATLAEAARTVVEFLSP
jgi:hypothetical protein